MKTRVYVESSEVRTNYYAQRQVSLFGIKWWETVDAIDGPGPCRDAVFTTMEALNKNHDCTEKEYAEMVCERLQYLWKEKQKDKRDARIHEETKSVWTYIFPEENPKG